MRLKTKSYIDIRIRGTMRVRAKNREEAAEKIRDRIMEEILIAHPSFGETGLPPVWEGWLNETTSKMLGIEIEEEYEETEETLDVTWSNIKTKERKLTKGGKIQLRL